MARLAAFLLAVITLFAADDPWTPVRNLRTGTEIRVVKKGSAQPVTATIDELREETLVVIVKNQQTAIPRDQIDRIDARPPQTNSRVSRESKAATTTGRDGKPNTSYSSGVSFGSKPDFETVYRRTASATK